MEQKLLLHLILCVGPKVIRNSVISARNDDDLEELLELVEGATCSNMLEMLLHATAKLRDDADGEVPIMKKIMGYFSEANLPQKRLMLQFTKQVFLKVKMIQEMSAN